MASYRRSRLQLWPIFVRVKNRDIVHVFPEETYLGKNKSEYIEKFLFFDEIKGLMKHGMQIENEVIKLKVSNVLIYSVSSGKLIIGEDFSNRRYLNPHQTRFNEVKTPLENTGLKMVTRVILLGYNISKRELV